MNALILFPHSAKLSFCLLRTLVLGCCVLATLTGNPRAVQAQSVMCQACDLDKDGDVDQEDFGRFQLCFSGAYIPQQDPACAAARLDADTDVDGDDLAILVACASGAYVPFQPGRLFISEFMASNSTTVADPEEPGQFPDWIELYNDSPAPIELGGMYLTNNLSEKTLRRIPDGVRIEGGSYLLFWADNEAGQGPRHVGLTLPEAGGEVGLIAPDGTTVIDSVTYSTQTTDVSMARVPDITDNWKPRPRPTPGQPNTSCVEAPLTIQSNLPMLAGRKYTTQNMAAFHGQGNACDTRSIVVNGQLAEWDGAAGTWRIGTAGGTVTTTLIAKGSTWRYLDNGTNQGTAWRATGFDDSSWKGPQAARLGYGNDGETSPKLYYGTSSTNKYITYYFRRTIAVGDSSKFSALKLRLLRDDGAIVYINGTQVPTPHTVDNMPDTFDYLTLASGTVDGTNEQTYFEASISPTLLTANTNNTIAVEVHQRAKDSSDLGFDMELVAETTTTTTGIPLTPGLNTVLVQAFDGPDGTGAEIERGTIEVFYDDMVHNVISGTLSANKTLTANLSPWHITGNVTVPSGITLTVEPGVTVLCEPNVRVIVNGRIQAVGATGSRIRFTRANVTAADWGGFNFTNNHNVNVFSYVDFEYANGSGNNRSAIIYISDSQVTFERDTFLNVLGHQIMDIWYPQVAISHSVFGDVGGAYMIMVENLSANGWFNVDGNLFGTNTGDTDIFHLNHISVKDGPKAVLTNNVFLGTGDDQIDDNESDSHIEGNLFLNSVTTHPARSASCAVTTGEGSGNGCNLHTQRLVVVRNVFWGNDYGIINKDGSALEVYNCVFVGNRGGIILDEPWRTDSGPGRSCFIESSIFWNNMAENGTDQGAIAYLSNPEANTTGRYYRGATQVTVNNSIIPASYHSLGTGNINADPMFAWPNNPGTISPADPMFADGFDGFDFDSFLVTNHLVPDVHLLPGSPAIGAGFNSTDMGCCVSANATISGEPPSITSLTSAMLSIDGLDIGGYKYRVIGPSFPDTWSPELQNWKYVSAIALSGTTAKATCTGHGFANGDTVEVKGADSLCPYYNGVFTIGNVTDSTFDYTVTPGSYLITPEPLTITWPYCNEGRTDIWCRKPQKVELSGLGSGTYRVEVIRKNSMGVWQDTNAPTTSKSWTVSP